MEQSDIPSRGGLSKRQRVQLPEGVYIAQSLVCIPKKTGCFNTILFPLAHTALHSGEVV